MDKNDIIEYVMHTPHNTNRAVLSSMLNQLAEDGGGGSSDFSTATVTFICNASNQVDVNFAAIKEASLPFVPSAQSFGGYQLYEGDELVANAILYKGRCSCVFIGATSVSGTGAIEIAGGEAIITGDCTITINGVDAGGID